MKTSQISSLTNNINKNIQIVVSDIDSDDLMEYDTLPISNAIIISAPKVFNNKTLTYTDSGIFSILMTDYNGVPVRLTRHINLNGFNTYNGEISLNVDNDSLAIDNNVLKIKSGYIDRFLSGYKFQDQINEINAKLDKLINEGENKEEQTSYIMVNDYNNIITNGEYIPIIENNPLYLILDNVYYLNDEYPEIIIEQNPNNSLNISTPESNK